MTQETIEIRVITASDGMVLTDGETYSKRVYLGVNDSPEDWQEVPDENATTERR